MSLCISIVTPEGIAVAGESRQTQTINNINRVGSDTAEKVFELTNRVLACTAGWAFLKPQGSANVRNIAALVEEFKTTIPPGSTVLQIAALMWTYFNDRYNDHIAQYPNAAVAQGQFAITFCVSGYNDNSRIGELYPFTVPSAQAPVTPVRTSNNPGTWWIGNYDVVSRIVSGFDFRLLDLAFVQAAIQNVPGAPAAPAPAAPIAAPAPAPAPAAPAPAAPAAAAPAAVAAAPAPAPNPVLEQLSGLGYVINYNTMTLQDSIDFVTAMIQVTITVQRFTAGIVSQMGGTTTVGGPIDVAVIRPGGTVQWVARKTLHS